MFDKWLIIRSGFRQHHGSPHNGCVDIYGEMCHKYGGNHNQVILEPWDACPEHTADFIYRLSEKDEPPTVAIFAYSWGVGYGAVRLAYELRERDIKVQYAVFCDPVYHGLARWRAILPRTFFSRVRITVPSNIREVWWLKQENSKPAGHDLVAESPYTEIHDPFVLDIPHTEMDNAKEFRILCRRVAKEVFGYDESDLPK
jgi:pimeloyl-ACP methyl ester carboxylesterase